MRELRPINLNYHIATYNNPQENNRFLRIVVYGLLYAIILNLIWLVEDSASL